MDGRLGCALIDLSVRFERRDGEPEGVSVHNGRQPFAGRRSLNGLAQNVPRAVGESECHSFTNKRSVSNAQALRTMIAGHETFL